MQADLDTPAEASVAQILDILAWEIELAGARCLKLDAIVDELMRTLPPELLAPLVEGMHTIDLLSQHLTSLSAFARGVSGAVPDQFRAPYAKAVNDMTLGALADRMAAALGADEKGINDGEEAGDLDLF